MFITPAYAEDVSGVAESATSAGGPLMTLLPIFLVLIVFYLMVIRPQNKRLVEHRNLINNLQKGDKVVTGGGIVAKVVKTIGDNEILLEIADDVQVVAVRSTIMMMRNQERDKEIDQLRQKQQGKK